MPLFSNRFRWTIALNEPLIKEKITNAEMAFEEIIFSVITIFFQSWNFHFWVSVKSFCDRRETESLEALIVFFVRSWFFTDFLLHPLSLRFVSLHQSSSLKIKKLIKKIQSDFVEIGFLSYLRFLLTVIRRRRQRRLKRFFWLFRSLTSILHVLTIFNLIVFTLNQYCTTAQGRSLVKLLK